ncbi:MAG: ATP-binding protein [Myxococcota bacterium]
MSIKTKTALAFAAFALVCVGTTAAILVHHEQVSLETAIVERQELLTVNRAIMLRDQLDLALVELMRVARTMEEAFQKNDPASERRVLAQAYRVLVFLTASVQLYDSDGNCKWAEPDPGHCRTVPPSNEAFQRTLRRDIPSFSFVPDPDGAGLVHLMAPLADEDGRTRGVLAGTIDLEEDRALIKPLSDELPAPAAIALLDRSGRQIYAQPSGTVEEMPPVEQLVSATDRPPRGSLRFGHGGSNHVVAWAPVERSGLSLLLVWPWEALQDSKQHLLRQLMWLLLGLGATALGIGYVLASTLTRPILQLARRVRDAKGNPVIEATRRADEVGELRNSFATLLQQLAQREEELRHDRDRISELAENLEQRVEDRTRQLQSAQEALVRAERLAAVGQAGAVLSHELRNSLNAISVGIDALAGPGLKEPAVRHAVHRDVRGEIERLRSLSDDLLAFARDPKLRLERTDVWVLLRRTIVLLDDQAETQGVFVELVVEGSPPEMRLDPERVQTLLMNLIKNGIEAAATTSAPRTVRTVVAADAENLRISVEDSGRGLAPEVVERLFQPFVTTKHAGTGLGLALAARFVQAHEGDLQVSRSDLGGARFEVRIPLHLDTTKEQTDHEPLRASRG